jgi:hypothetical protein
MGLIDPEGKKHVFLDLEAAMTCDDGFGMERIWTEADYIVQKCPKYMCLSLSLSVFLSISLIMCIFLRRLQHLGTFFSGPIRLLKPLCNSTPKKPSDSATQFLPALVVHVCLGSHVIEAEFPFCLDPDCDWLVIGGIGNSNPK